MSINNLVIRLEILWQDELAKIESGETRLGVSNQHHATVLESALENLNAENIEAVAKLHDVVDINIICTSFWAYELSDFTPPEIPRSWID